MPVLDKNQITRMLQVLPAFNGAITKATMNDAGDIIVTYNDKEITWGGLEPHWLEFILNGVKLSREEN